RPLGGEPRGVTAVRLLPDHPAAHRPRCRVGRAVRVRHVVRRAGGGAVPREPGTADAAAPDLERRAGEHQPDHHRRRRRPDPRLDRADGGGRAAAETERTTPGRGAAVTDVLVSLRDVEKSYDGETLVVKKLNLDVARGEFLTLLGPSGSGKTTCLMMLAGFESVTAGEIVLEGRRINDVPPYKRGIGIVFQNYALFPH